MKPARSPATHRSTLRLEELAPKLRRRLTEAIGSAIASSKAASDQRHWRHLVVVIRTDSPPTVKLRIDLASALRAADVGALAREVQARRVGRGEILVYLELDEPATVEHDACAFVGVFVVDVIQAARTYLRDPTPPAPAEGSGSTPAAVP